MNNRYSYKNASSNFRYINSFHLYLNQRRFIKTILHPSSPKCLETKNPTNVGLDVWLIKESISTAPSS